MVGVVVVISMGAFITLSVLHYIMYIYRVLYTYHIYILGECSTLWGERERGSVVGVYVSSHRKLIRHIGCCRSPQLLAFSAGRAHTG